ncbi:MAG TPA: hypothetical protein VGB35_03050 [Gammaproteobacteria bacterium]|jgi:hypothetical protein
MSATEKGRFSSAKLKVERAKIHVRELSNQIVDYLKSKPFKVVVELDKESSLAGALG